MFRHGFSNFRVRDIRRVLGGDEDGVDAFGFALRILDRDLTLRIGTKPGDGPIFAKFTLPTS